MSTSREEHVREEVEESRIAPMYLDDVHPVLRRVHAPEPERDNCRACGRELPVDALTDDLLCKSCDANVKLFEAGRV